MITQMKKYTFLVFHRDYEAFLEQLRSLGVVHITEKASGTAEDATLQPFCSRQTTCADHCTRAPDTLQESQPREPYRLPRRRRDDAVGRFLAHA